MLHNPDSVTEINGAFFFCKDLTSVIIPDGVKRIGVESFFACESLESINLPNSLLNIGIGAFKLCKNLTAIRIPEDVVSIDIDAFSMCENLISVEIPDSVMSIGYDAFYGCPELTIECIKGSYAEEYAKNEGLPYALVPLRKSALSTKAALSIKGRSLSLEAYNIDGYNYFKLRDLAAVLYDTERQFELYWDEDNNTINLISGVAYTPNGDELTILGNSQNKTAISNSAIICLDGKEVDIVAYNIGGYNYFKLRDLALLLNFSLTYDRLTKTIFIDTVVTYSS